VNCRAHPGSIFLEVCSPEFACRIGVCLNEKEKVVGAAMEQRERA